MKAVIGRKIEMTQIFASDGNVLPVTKILVETANVTQVKSLNSKDKYQSVQIASGLAKHPTKSLLGHFKGKKFRFVKEFKLTGQEFQVGDNWGCEIFQEGEKINVTSISKGKGFQGVVKRWGFHGSPATHGHKDQLRMPGSIGAGGLQRVIKGLRMGGHMGNAQVTTKNLKVAKVDIDNNFIYVMGAVPGARNAKVYVTATADMPAVKKATSDKKEEVIVETKE